ncbi:MAG: N-(5'-phosphoribosyl)anthranilate isomerase, partial [Acidobacteriota bacterium]
MTTKIKICGITDPNDALEAASLGAYAVGFNFYSRSPRYISPGSARKIVDMLPAEIVKIGVFVNEEPAIIAQIVETAGLDQIQLHGDEDVEFIERVRDLT